MKIPWGSHIRQPGIQDTQPEKEEVTSALKVLGYTTKEIEKALSKITTTNQTIEETIKQALKELG